MSAQPVDVLAVMDEAAEYAEDSDICERVVTQLRDARAAVDKLIDAARECEDLLSELADGGMENPEFGILRAALAGVGQGVR